METLLRRHLEVCATTFGKGTGREPSTVAQLATGDWQFFERLKNGASFTARRYDKIMAWFCVNWPAEIPWPDGIPRSRFDKPGLHSAVSVDDDGTMAPGESAGAENAEQNISRTAEVQA